MHQSQIRRAVGADEVGGETLTWAARVVVHVLAAWMRDFSPAAGSAIQLDFGPAGSWTCERTRDQWVVHEAKAAGAGAAARISVAPTAIVAMLSRGVTQEAAPGLLTVTGDTALASGALEIVAPLLGTPDE